MPLGAVGLYAVRRFLPNDAHHAPPFDFIGCALLSMCMVSFSLALDSPFQTHRGVWSAALFGVAAASVLAYIPYARRSRNPIFKLALFREPNFSVGLIGNLLCRIGSSAVPFLLPLLMQLELGYSPLHSGLVMIPIAIAATISKRWIARLVKRYGYDTFLLVNTMLVGASIVAFSLFSPSFPLAAEIAIFALFGACNSMQFAAMNSVTLKGLSIKDAGSGNSLFSMVQTLAIGLGVSIGGSLVQVFQGEFGSAAAGFKMSFVCMGVVTLLSDVVFRRLDRDSTSAAPAPAAR
ncbi:putative transport protein [Candidatus Burkholderia humilis]|nr:putative transport protein [Candidatus Burkholderia humilis]